MIFLTFSLALLLIYFTTEPISPVDIAVSSQQSSDEENSSAVSSDTTSSEDINHGNDTSSHEKITMEFTPDEIAQIDNLITAAKNSQMSDKSSDSSIDDTSSNSSKNKIAIPSSVSIYFEDIESGFVYTHNDEYKYFIASLVKAPYCMYLYTLAEQGKCDLDEIFTVEFKDIQEGTGKIKKEKPENFPLKMTVRELMSYSIRYSDNTAMEALRKRYNHVGYTEYAQSLGLHYPKDVAYIVNGKITAKDAGVYIKAIYNYIENGKYGSELKEDMSKTTNPMIRSKHPIIRKYGWAELSFHDMAIVNSPHPYLLVILSDKGLGNSQDHKLFADISRLIESFQKKRYDEM